MTEDERLALIWEATDALGDDPLLIPVLIALRDEGFRDAVRGLLDVTPHARRTAATVRTEHEPPRAANAPDA